MFTATTARVKKLFKNKKKVEREWQNVDGVPQLQELALSHGQSFFLGGGGFNYSSEKEEIYHPVPLINIHAVG